MTLHILIVRLVDHRLLLQVKSVARTSAGGAVRHGASNAAPVVDPQRGEAGGRAGGCGKLSSDHVLQGHALYM